MERSHLRRVLLLPGWYPTKSNFISGTFVVKHASAAARISDIIVIRAGAPPDEYRTEFRTIWVPVNQCVRFRYARYV